MDTRVSISRKDGQVIDLMTAAFKGSGQAVCDLLTHGVASETAASSGQVILGIASKGEPADLFTVETDEAIYTATRAGLLELAKAAGSIAGLKVKAAKVVEVVYTAEKAKRGRKAAAQPVEI